MQVIRSLDNPPARLRGCVLTIGNFDGLHLGHQAMLRLTRQTARDSDRQAVLMSFEPLPHEYFARRGQAETPRPRLLNAGEKLLTLGQFDASLRPDALLLPRFAPRLAAMPAAEFIERILVERLGISALVVGDDFRFGAGRGGDAALLREYGAQHGFAVQALDSHHVGGQRVSSTLIRQALAAGDLARAEAMLGRPYSLCGRVTHGDKRGRSIGFPTANIPLRRRQSPLRGVYSVTMHVGDEARAGIANIGRRPTVDGEREQLEVHLFDYSGDLYGRRVCIAFRKKIRDEKKFASLDELKQQIERDCQQAIADHQQP